MPRRQENGSNQTTIRLINLQRDETDAQKRLRELKNELTEVVKKGRELFELGDSRTQNELLNCLIRVTSDALENVTTCRNRKSEADRSCKIAKGKHDRAQGRIRSFLADNKLSISCATGGVVGSAAGAGTALVCYSALAAAEITAETGAIMAAAIANPITASVVTGVGVALIAAFAIGGAIYYLISSYCPDGAARQRLANEFRRLQAASITAGENYRAAQTRRNTIENEFRQADIEHHDLRALLTRWSELPTKITQAEGEIARINGEINRLEGQMVRANNNNEGKLNLWEIIKNKKPYADKHDAFDEKEYQHYLRFEGGLFKANYRRRRSSFAEREMAFKLEQVDQYLTQQPNCR